MNQLRLKNLSVSYGKMRALDDVSLDLNAGEAFMVAGPNGAGKSTMIQVLLGLVKPEQGSIEIDGRAVTVDKAFKRRIGYLPESVAFGENLSGREVLRFFAAARGVDKKRIGAMLERVGLAAAADRAVKGYSRGMRQRLGLAVAVLAEPDFLLLDEPTGGLDQEGISVLSTLIADWRQAGKMVLLSSHDLSLFERKVDRVCLLRQGKVLALETPAGLRESTPWLPVRVTLRLGDDPAVAAELIREVSDMADGSIVSGSSDAVVVDIMPRSLRQLLSMQARFNGSVHGIRVEEPGLDMVYDSLVGNDRKPQQEAN